MVFAGIGAGINELTAANERAQQENISRISEFNLIKEHLQRENAELKVALEHVSVRSNEAPNRPLPEFKMTTASPPVFSGNSAKGSAAFTETQ